MNNRQRHIAIMLDIDNTLVVFDKSQDILWWTGSRMFWRQQLIQFKANMAKYNIIVHYGIATLKPTYLTPNHQLENLKGDSISRTILEDERFGLKDLIDPDLVFFLLDEYNKATTEEAQDKCKAEFGLKPAHKILSDKYPGLIDPVDMTMIDDQSDICVRVKEAGFNAICVDNLYRIEIGEQFSVIKKVFEELTKFHTPKANMIASEEKTQVQNMESSSSSTVSALLNLMGQSPSLNRESQALEPKLKKSKETHSPSIFTRKPTTTFPITPIENNNIFSPSTIENNNKSPGAGNSH